MPASSEAHYLVRKLLILPTAGDVLRRHRWGNEAGRWQELVAALLSQALKLPNTETHGLCHRLRVLKLLDIDEWQDASSDASEAKKSDVVHRTLQLFEDHGFGQDQAELGVRVIQEAAIVVSRKFKGKAQVALRAVGNGILDDLHKAMNLESLPQAASRRALGVWLQNVLNLPISLNADRVDLFCRFYNITQAQLTDRKSVV